MEVCRCAVKLEGFDCISGWEGAGGQDYKEFKLREKWEYPVEKVWWD